MKIIIRILLKPATSDICTPQVYGVSVWCVVYEGGVWCMKVVHEDYY
jgi:hypothetical protein